MNKILLLSLFILFHFSSHSQNSDAPRVDEPLPLWEQTSRGIATGIHINKYPMLELGYFQHTIFENYMTFGGSYTVESYFIDKVVMAPKINYWGNISFINAGFSIPWYFDFEGNNSLRIRPEVGFGFANFKINYAPNIALTHKDMEYVGTHLISVHYYIKLKELPHRE